MKTRIHPFHLLEKASVSAASKPPNMPPKPPSAPTSAPTIIPAIRPGMTMRNPTATRMASKAGMRLRRSGERARLRRIDRPLRPHPFFAKVKAERSVLVEELKSDRLERIAACDVLRFVTWDRLVPCPDEQLGLRVSEGSTDGATQLGRSERKGGIAGLVRGGVLPERAALTRSTSAAFLASATLRVFVVQAVDGGEDGQPKKGCPELFRGHGLAAG